MLPETLLVVDTCALEDPGLRHFLQASPGRGIIFDPLTLFEMVKVNPLFTSQKSLSILSEFADRIHVTHPSHRWLKACIATEADLEQLIDPKATADLRALCEGLRQTPLPEWIDPYLQARCAEAEDYIRRLTAEVSEIDLALRDRALMFSKQQLSEIYAGKEISDGTRRKINEMLHDVTGQFILAYQEPGRTDPLKTAVAKNMFAFRYALCVVFFYLDWVQHGKSWKRLDRRVNDVIDLQIATVSTFFNGLMTNEKRLSAIASKAAWQLVTWQAFIREFREDNASQPADSRSHHS